MSDPEHHRANLIRALAWSWRVSRPVAVFQHPAGVPLTLAFHPGGEYLISSPAPYPGATMVWDLAAEKPRALPGERGAATAASWSPDGDWLALGTRDGASFADFLI